MAICARKRHGSQTTSCGCHREVALPSWCSCRHRPPSLAKLPASSPSESISSHQKDRCSVQRAAWRGCRPRRAGLSIHRCHGAQTPTPGASTLHRSEWSCTTNRLGTTSANREAATRVAAVSPEAERAPRAPSSKARVKTGGPDIYANLCEFKSHIPSGTVGAVEPPAKPPARMLAMPRIKGRRRLLRQQQCVAGGAVVGPHRQRQVVGQGSPLPPRKSHQS